MRYCTLTAFALLFMQSIFAQELESAVSSQIETVKAAPPKKKSNGTSKTDANCPSVCFEKGHEMAASCASAGYSAPAGIEVSSGYDVVADVSFLYWGVMQGGMDLAIPLQGTIASGILTSHQAPALGRAILIQKNEYKPGFQLGLGWSGPKDNWALHAEYTYLHGSSNTSSAAESSNVTTIGGVAIEQSGIYVPTSWFSGSHFDNLYVQSISSKWQYKIDLLDAQMSRAFYSGTRFSLEPFFGLRGAWIRQKMSLSAPILRASSATSGPVWEAHYSSRSAAVGPRAGMNGSWLLGYGFRFIGDAAASLLFTNYDVKQNISSPDANVAGIKTKYNDLNLLRPNLDFSLGFGWGSYFCCRQMHWDLSLTYDFSVFWGQNMMRALADLTANETVWPSASAADLYLQGLTVSTRFDF